MSATDDVARMLALVPWLLARKDPTLAETASAFGVSEDQIRRDAEQLNFCGLPGFRGGDLFECDLVGDRISLRMADELRRPLRLGPAEAVRMVLLLETAVGLLDGDLPALRSGLAKVRRAAGVPDTVTVEVAKSETTAASRLRRAVADGRRVTFTYQGRADEGPRTRRVDPWGVRVQEGHVYLQGHDLDARGGRSFRLDRLSDLEVLDEPATKARPARLGPPRYEAGPDDLKLVLQLAPEGRWIAELLDPDEVVDRRDGGARVTLRTDAPGWIERLVLQAAGGASIHQPKPQREALAARVRAALARYED